MVRRKKIHTRQMAIESYERDDGLWDLEAKLVDFKSYDFTRSDGSVRKAGEAVHDMTICLQGLYWFTSIKRLSSQGS